MRLLLVEDDRMIGRGLRQALQSENFAVDWVQDGTDATTAISDESYDLAILDLGLPGRDGLDVLRHARARGQHLPVLILTAREAIEDRVAGLNAGADDYLGKPFALDELIARVRALLRRRHGHATPTLEHRGVNLDPATRQVTQDGHPVQLTQREFALLNLLMQRPGAVLSRDQLLSKLYGWQEEVESNTVEVYIHGLRRKLGADFIITIRGAGYCLANEIDSK